MEARNLVPQLMRQSFNGPVLFQLLTASSDEACVHTCTHLHHLGAAAGGGVLLLQSNLYASFTSVNPQGGLAPPRGYTHRLKNKAGSDSDVSCSWVPAESLSTATRFTKVASRNLGVSHSVTRIHTHQRLKLNISLKLTACFIWVRVWSAPSSHSLYSKRSVFCF